MLSSRTYGGPSMDVQQMRKLKPKLKQFLKEFDDCFPRKDTAAHLPVYISGQLSDIPEKSVEPIAINAGVPPRTLQEFLSQHKWDGCNRAHAKDYAAFLAFFFPEPS